MEVLTTVCGKSKEIGPAMNVLCEYTAIKLQSSGKYQNEVAIVLGLPDLSVDNPLTLFCGAKNEKSIY